MFAHSFERARRAVRHLVVSSNQKPAKAATRRAAAAAVESLEDRTLFAANIWKSAVSGSWEDASKWSLGRVPTIEDDVKINVAGNYAVTINSTASGAQYLYAKSVTVGGVTGTQTLNVNKALYAYGVLTLGTGDVINVEAGGKFSNYSYGSGTTTPTHTINGTINLKANSSRSATFDTYKSNIVGTGGQIVAVTGGAYVNNYMYLSGSTVNNGVTIRGKNLSLYNVVNKSTIKAEGGSADYWYVSGLNNQGSFTATGGSRIELESLTNAAGKTISVTGVTNSTGAKVGSLRLMGNTYSNLGTINVKDVAKLEYDQVFKKIGTINRNGIVPLFGGQYDGNGGAFSFNSTDGQWIWDGGELYNGSYNPTGTYVPKVDLVKGSGYGMFENVTLTGNLSVPADFYYNVTGTLTLGTGGKITLNGTSTKTSGIDLYGTLAGNGEVVLATGGVGARSIISSNGGSIGSGILIHGKSGRLNGFILNGTILANAANETIEVGGVTNRGNIIAAPGTVKLLNYVQESTGALTVGLGGTSYGVNAGRFQFADPTYASKLAGTFNVVLLNGYLPNPGTTFNFATFTKAPTGTFATKNLDAGNGKAFDLTQSTTSLSLKSKNVTGAHSSRSSSGALTVNGTTGNDTMTISRSLNILHVVVGGKKSVFYDRGLISVTANGGDGNDTITVSGGRGVTLNGGNGTDKLTGGDGDDILNGGEGSDTLIGGRGNDRYVFANASASQTDTINEYSGGGTDTLDFSTVTGKVTIKLNSDTATAVMTNRTVKTNTGGAAQLENANGGIADDSITGNNANNALNGGKGNDVIDGGAGNDTLAGSDGNDTLRGGTGNDTIRGGIGNDKLYGDAGTDSLYGESGADTLYGGGDATKDLLDGGADTDLLGSRDSIDTLVSVP